MIRVRIGQKDFVCVGMPRLQLELVKPWMYTLGGKRENEHQVSGVERKKTKKRDGERKNERKHAHMCTCACISLRRASQTYSDYVQTASRLIQFCTTIRKRYPCYSVQCLRFSR